ncbi:MAG TPA: UDP-N-acetylmuramate--L-alanine ligase [Candidatus Limnocylindria bacterium]|nr:UDP-N-acetylmuramate--L-alanine ligase [Candidatus Limnocylindria bacterium]
MAEPEILDVSALNPQQVNALLASAGRGATVHLVGAGGCGVSGLAHLLLDAGFCVHGSDAIENEEIWQLRARGAVIHIGHATDHLRASNPVLVVYSPAVRGDNPELQAARQSGIPLVRRAILLAAFVNQQRGICVAGMHGKTTTSALLAYALEKLGAQPSYAIGALLPQLPAHARHSAKHDSWFVVEADESDGTLCEFSPVHSIVLNIDNEHLDHFPNLQAVCREFEQFVTNTRDLVIFCADDARVAAIMAERPGAISYGFNLLAQYRVEAGAQVSKSKAAPAASHFTVWHRGVRLGEFSVCLFGEKNISNATAVVALLHQLGYSPDAIHGAIREFSGAARRQQELFADANVRLFDDYGHHPNEVHATLRAFKQLNPQRLVVVFQPHRYSRTKHLMADFAASFGDADKLFLTEVYAASEPEIPGANGAALAEAIRAHGQPIEYISALKDVIAAVCAAMRAGDLVLFLGAGDITKAAHELARTLKSGGTTFSLRNETTNMNDTGNKLRAAVSADTIVRQDEPLAKRTTLRVGGKADFFAEPANEKDLSGVLRLCGELKLPFTIIGRGSNLLIRDGGIRGVVISLGHENFSRVQIIGEHLHCGAGAKLKTVSVEARRAGLAGLEFLEGIPGSVGGSLRMNAGAMGSWMFEVVEQIRFMDFSGNAHERKASEVNVEYRGCPLFKTHIALGAVLRGTPSSKEVIQARANQFNAKRWETQPAQPSAGCIFKNPQTVPAGKLIDELGLKGTKHGGAMVSTVHGNFIVNEGGATAKDVLELIEFIKQTAKARRGIDLETEVEIIGE